MNLRRIDPRVAAFRVSNSIGDPGTFTGTMTDSCSLAGPSLHLSIGFIAAMTTNLSNVFVFDPINSRGRSDRLRRRLRSLRPAVTVLRQRRLKSCVGSIPAASTLPIEVRLRLRRSHDDFDRFVC
jgi:hypothetical protein